MHQYMVNECVVSCSELIVQTGERIIILS